MQNVKTPNDRLPYTYLIGWSKLNIWYYGSKCSKGCHPSYLFNFELSGRQNYKTSSKYVKDFIEMNGLPNIIQIRKIFNSKSSCIKWESKVLKRLDAKNSPKYLNKTNGNSDWYNPNYKPTTLGRSAAKCSITGTRLGSISTSDPRWLSGEIVAANKGYKHKESSRKLLSVANKNKTQSPERIAHRAKMNTGKIRPISAVESTASKNRGMHYHTKETKEAQSKRMNSRIMLQCPYCLKECDPANYKRWHGQNCKLAIK